MKELDEKALTVIAVEATKKVRELAKERDDWKFMGYVGAALLTEQDECFTGVNLSLFCGIGFCAEHSAVAEMIKHGQTRIKKIVAVTAQGNILPPCGRCREMMYQVDRDNLDAEVIVGIDKNTEVFYIQTLRELLPNNWQESMDQPLT